MTPRRTPAMTGTQLQANVVARCAWYRLRTAYFRPAQTRDGRWMTAVGGDGKGWPDLVIVGPGGVLYREIKRQTNDPVTAEQAEWLADLVAAGQDADVWRPADLASGRIERELRALRAEPRTTPVGGSASTPPPAPARNRTA